MAKNLTARTAKGIQWNALATAGTILLQVSYMAIMARLVSKEAFGVVAFASVIIHFGVYFSQMGLAQAIVQKEHISPEEIRAAFTANTILSLFFFVVFEILALYTPYFLEQAPPEAVLVMQLMALCVLFEGLQATSFSLLRRELRFKSIAIRNLTSYILAYMLLGTTLAWLGWDIWALVAAMVGQVFLHMVLSYWAVRHSLIPTLEWAHYRALFGFGSKVSVIGFLEYLGHHLDVFLIGKLNNTASLGLYNRAAHLINIPLLQLTRVFSQVLFPSLSKIQKETERLQRVYLAAIMLIFFVVAPIAVGVFIAAMPIVRVVLGNKWDEAIPVLQILALSTPFRFTSTFGGVVCNATATLNAKLILQVLFMLVLTSVMFLLMPLGIVGFAWAVLFAEVAKSIAYMIVVKKIVHYTWGDLWRVYKGGIATTLLVMGLSGLVWYLNEAFRLPALLHLGLAVLAGVLGILVSLRLPFTHTIRVELADKLEKVFAKRGGGKSPTVRKLLHLLGLSAV